MVDDRYRDRPLPFRRRRFAAPHRRRRLALRLVWPFLGALAAVAVPAAAAWWTLVTPALAVREIEVAGTDRVPAEWVRERLEPIRGRHLLDLELGEIEARLAGADWIRGVTLAKELPDKIFVRIHERVPAALLRRGGELLLLDRAGEVIAPFEPRQGVSGLLVVSVADGVRLDLDAALELAEELERRAPEWAAGLSEIEVASERDFRIYTEALPFALFLDRENLEPAIARLPALLPKILRRYPAVGAVDARFSNQIVIQPAARPLSQEG